MIGELKADNEILEVDCADLKAENENLEIERKGWGIKMDRCKQLNRSLRSTLGKITKLATE